MTFRPVDELSVDRARGRVHEPGWQSWSPVGSEPIGRTLPRPATDVQQVMRFRSETPSPAGVAQGEGLLLIEPGTGEPTRLYSVTDVGDRVPSIRAETDGPRVRVQANGPVACDLVEGDTQRVLAGFGDRFAYANALQPPRDPPTVWCSWYHYFLQVTEADIVENLASIDRHDLPVDVVQLDDGWQAAVGDWLTSSDRFSSVADVADRIRSSGRRPGIWLAPFVVAEHSAVARTHPDWLVSTAGRNWDQQLFGLDLTHPEVGEYLHRVLAQLRDWGFDYFKLDFLYAGALPGPRRRDSTAIAAYRYGLQLVREAVGQEAYLLGCGAPLLPSAGLVDAMRVSPDTYHPDPADPARVGRLRSVRGTVERAWQHGRFWVNDPDCLVLRPSAPWRAEWAELVARHGGLRAFSDRIADLDRWGIDTARRLLTDRLPATPLIHP